MTLEDLETYNCYGYVAYVKGWKAEVENLTYTDIAEMLEDNTDYVSSEYVEAGDIAVWEIADFITHVAIVLDAEKHTVMQKAGHGKLEESTYDNKYGTVSYFKRRN